MKKKQITLLLKNDKPDLIKVLNTLRQKYSKFTQFDVEFILRPRLEYEDTDQWSFFVKFRDGSQSVAVNWSRGKDLVELVQHCIDTDSPYENDDENE